MRVDERLLEKRPFWWVGPVVICVCYPLQKMKLEILRYVPSLILMGSVSSRFTSLVPSILLASRR